MSCNNRVQARAGHARTARGALPTGPTPRHTTPTWSTSMARRRASKACRFRRESTGTTYTRALFGCGTRLQKVPHCRASTDRSQLCSLPRALIAAQRGTSPDEPAWSPREPCSDTSPCTVGHDDLRDAARRPGQRAEGHLQEERLHHQVRRPKKLHRQA